VDSEKEFQEKMRRLGTLVGELDQLPGAGSKVELVQLLMDVHRSALERIMELVSESGSEPAGATVDKLGQDPIVRNLLLLYSLHPDNLETRVLQAIDALRTPLRKLDSRVELTNLQGGDVQLRVHTSGHARGSMLKDLRSIVQGGIYDLAPDVTSLTILGLEEEAGFVPLESLLKHAPAAKEAQDACY